MSFISTSFALNFGQQTALARLQTFLADPAPDNPIFAISGAAGTGKTTLLRHAATALGDDAQICAPTNKAADVLRSKGFAGARTLSSVLDTWTPISATRATTAAEKQYFVENHLPIEDMVTVVEFVRKDGGAAFTTILCDESSVCTQKDFERLQASGAKVIFVGDGSQLPPVGEPGWFQNYKHDVSLGQNMRSDGEILQLCAEIRAGKLTGVYDTQRWKREVIVSRDVCIGAIAECQMVLTYGNADCNKLNLGIRTVRDLIDENSPQRPMKGSKLLGWQTAPDFGIKKSIVYTVVTDSQPIYRTGGLIGFHCDLLNAAGVVLKDVPVSNLLLRDQKLSLDLIKPGMLGLSYGFCTTGHKAQGDEADSVAVVLPPYLAKMPNHNNWLYTTVSRARQVLLIAHGWR